MLASTVELSLEVDQGNQTWQAYAEVTDANGGRGIASFHFDVFGEEGIEILDDTDLLDNTTSSTFPLFASAGSFGLDIHASQDTLSNGGRGGSSIDDEFGLNSRALVASGGFTGSQGTLSLEARMSGSSTGFLLFGGQVDHVSVIDADFADFVVSDSITLGDDAVSKIDLTLVTTPTSVDGNGEVGSLPEDKQWIDEWTAFFIEIWASTPQAVNHGIGSVSLSVPYEKDYFTATQVEYGPGFVGNPIEKVDQVEVSLENLTAATSENTIADDNYALVARIKFQSLENDGVEFNGFGQYIQPVDSPWFGISDPLIELSGDIPTMVEQAELPRTELWPVMYDMDDDGKVYFGDVSYLASVFSQDIHSSQNNSVYAADFDHSGTVDFGDASFLSANFQVGKADEKDVIYPVNFPESWRFDEIDEEAAVELLFHQLNMTGMQQETDQASSFANPTDSDSIILTSQDRARSENNRDQNSRIFYSQTEIDGLPLHKLMTSKLHHRRR